MAPAPKPRSYGCSFGCGNPYDFVVATVSDSTTLFLCAPCFCRTAMEMIQAIVDPDSINVQAKLRKAGDAESVPMSGNGVKARGHNAPADTDDDDLIEAFDSVITAEELGDEFR